MKQLLDAFKTYIQCQIELSKKEPLKITEVKPFVTISRQTGAGGILIGRRLISYLIEEDHKASLPWTIFDKTLVDAILNEHNLPETVEKYMPEKKISEFRDIFETMWELHPPAFALVRQTSETIMHLGQIGYSVIVGRGANVVTQKLEGGFHVRLVASPERRQKNVEGYYGLSAKEAEHKMKSEDKGRADYLKQNFGKDINDPLLYDIVINTDRLSVDDAARVIADEVLRRKSSQSISS